MTVIIKWVVWPGSSCAVSSGNYFINLLPPVLRARQGQVGVTLHLIIKPKHLNPSNIILVHVYISTLTLVK